MTRMDRPGAWIEWDAFLETQPQTGFMQSSWWADFRTFAGFENFGAIVKSEGAILGGAVVLKYRHESDSCFYYIPEGPVLPRDPALAQDVCEVILRSIDERRAEESECVSHLRIEPRWEERPPFLIGFDPVPEFADRFMEPRTTLCVDLRVAEEEILSGMKPKGRYNVRLAFKHGVQVVEDSTDSGVADFLRIYGEMVQRQGLDAKPPEYFQALIASLAGRGKGAMYFAEAQGERLATALVVYFGDRATYFFGASTERHRELMAPYALHFDIMRRAKARGCSWYDLWGVAPNDDEEHPWHDITVFKKKFGGELVRLVPTLDFVFDREAYERYLETERPERATIAMPV